MKLVLLVFLLLGGCTHVCDRAASGEYYCYWKPLGGKQ